MAQATSYVVVIRYPWRRGGVVGRCETHRRRADAVHAADEVRRLSKDRAEVRVVKRVRTGDEVVLAYSPL